MLTLKDGPFFSGHPVYRVYFEFIHPGYDLAHAIRLWLSAVGKPNCSVNEILYTEQRKAAYDEGTSGQSEEKVVVKKQPHAFISHVQVESLGTMMDELESGCLYNGMRRAESQEHCVPLEGK